MNLVFWTYLDHNLSDIYIGNIRLIYRTNCALSRTKNTCKISRIFPTYISDKLCSKSDQKTRAKKVGQNFLSDLFCPIWFIWAISDKIQKYHVTFVMYASALKPSLTYVFEALSQLGPRNTEYFNVTVRYQKTNARLALSLSYHSLC